MSRAAPHVAQYCESHDLRLGTHPENLAAMRLHQWGHEPAPQYRIGRYLVDFAFTRDRIALEIDGPHHQRPDIAVKDTFRDGFLRDRGWLVIRLHYGDTFDEQLSSVSRLLHALERNR